MKPTLHSQPDSNEAIVDRARRRLMSKQQAPWLTLAMAVVFLGYFGWFLVQAKRRILESDSESVRMEFIWGFLTAVIWMFLGLTGSLCLGKFLSGFLNDFRKEELLVQYHDRLRDLGQLPADPATEKVERKQSEGAPSP